MPQMESAINSLIQAPMSAETLRKVRMHKKKGTQIMFSLTPNSTQKEPTETLLQHLALFR
jgi:hypothetical protein